MENETTIKIDGMNCSSCAAGIVKYLEREGLQDVHVDFTTGEAEFVNTGHKDLKEIAAGINSLGYKAHLVDTHGHSHHHEEASEFFSLENKFLFCLLFSLPLFSHMFLPWAILHDPMLQLALALPVMIVGAMHFGRSAFSSLKTGVPNMDVLIVIGAGSAFVYSLIGTFRHYGTIEVHNYLFYETGATIITLVLLGNLLEHRSVKQTTTAIDELSLLKVSKAKKILPDDSLVEVTFEQIHIGDLLLINNGDKVPVDGEIVWGNASINESMITGESLPVDRTPGDTITGGTILVDGSIKMVAQRVGKDTLLSKIIELVKKAQHSKPAIQQLGDKVSGIFVPVVVLISLATFFVSYLLVGLSLEAALMHSIAVLVISCPCAMGLATPTAVIVGIGRAAKRGILIKGGKTLEDFAGIRNMVFDKTGTLTTGVFEIKKIHTYNVSEEFVKDLVYRLESHSTHPLAVSLTGALKPDGEKKSAPFERVVEQKGLGVLATDGTDVFEIGSYATVKHLTTDDSHTVYLQKNNVLIAAIDMEDAIRPHVKETLAQLKSKGINLILLSGDRKEKCEKLALELGIATVYSEQKPDEKLNIIRNLVNTAPTAMVGDGINDAPALETATVGISLGNATQVAIQSAQVILLHADFNSLAQAYDISRLTLKTIKQNLFWAFFYNVVAIPIAAVGMLSPMVAALSMAFSDVIVIGNSLRLKTKKIAH